MGEALKYALTLDVDVINISMLVYEEDWIDSNGELHEGANGIKNYLGTYIDELTKNGTVVVASSGNDATDQLAYPAALDNVIAVGAVASTPLQRFASYSNYGYNTVVAPGTVYVPSTNYSKTDELERYSAYSIVSGTSFSAPLVAASIGLYRSLYPNASAEEIRNALINSATKVTTANYDEKYGYGILSVQNFLGVEPNANYSLVIFVVIFAIVLLLLFVVAAIIILLKRRSSKLNN